MDTKLRTGLDNVEHLGQRNDWIQRQNMFVLCKGKQKNKLMS